MDSSSKKKRKQHVVWRHYLASWAKKDKIWCIRNGKRFLVNVRDAAQKRDFYRLKEFTEADLRILERLFRNSDPLLQDLNDGWCVFFQGLFMLQHAYLANGRKDPEIEAQLDLAINNTEENLHAAVENDSVKFLAELKTCECSFLKNASECTDFMFFIALQYFRTSQKRNSIIKLGKTMPDFNIEAAWGLMRTILATNLGEKLFSNRRTLSITFLDAGPSRTFITGDQPIVNTCAIGENEGVPLTEMELYYPLSPSIALLLKYNSSTPGKKRLRLTDDETAVFNKIIKNSSAQIFADTENALLSLDTDT